MDGINELFRHLSEDSRALTALEIAGVVTAIAYTVLAAYEKIACWIFGLVSSAIYVYICFTAKLYQDVFIQLYYFAMAIYGWLLWGGLISKTKTEIAITVLPARKFALLAGCGLMIAPLSGFLFSRYTDASLPYMDAFVTVFALIGTWMQARKFLQNWIIFIVVDFVCIFMFYVKELYFTSFLFLIYTLLSIIALIAWKKKLQVS